MSVTSVVNFENYSVKDFLFQRNGNFPNEHVEIEFDFKAEAAINEEKTQATILLECTVEK